MCRLLKVILPLFFFASSFAQTKVGVEQYSYLSAGQVSAVAPIAHYTAKSKWYTEARYNYDELNTFSLYAGKTFSSDKDFAWSFTPMLGGLVGQMNGGSLGLNMDLSFGKFYFSSQSQYSVSADSRTNNYFFNWSEIGYEPVEWLFTGLSMQHTQLYRTNGLTEPGLMLGVSYKQVTIPFYVFNARNSSRFFVVGFNFEWEHKKPEKKSVDLLSLESLR